MDTSKNAKAPCLAVDVMRRCELWGDAPGDAELTRVACAAFEAARGADDCEISLLLTSDEEIRALNKNWRGKDEPTNVLSFPLDETADGAESQTSDPQRLTPRHLGDVVLACETVTREAQTRGIELGQHSAHLVVHGVLHLLGYDHENDGDALKMENLEVQILATLGLPDPYSSDIMRNGETS